MNHGQSEEALVRFQEIIDDYSWDNSVKIVKKLMEEDSRIEIICNEKNMGAAFSRNEGIKKAKYDLIAILDADDYSLEDRLEKQIDFLSKNSDVGIVGSAAFYINEVGKETIVVMPESNEKIQAVKIWKCPFINSSTLFKKSIFNTVNGYNPKFKRSQDYDLWLRMLRKTKGINLQIPLIIYNDTKSVKITNQLYFTLLSLINEAKREKISILKFLAVLFKHFGSILKNKKYFSFKLIFYKIDLLLNLQLI